MMGHCNNQPDCKNSARNESLMPLIIFIEDVPENMNDDTSFVEIDPLTVTTDDITDSSALESTLSFNVTPSSQHEESSSLIQGKVLNNF